MLVNDGEVDFLIQNSGRICVNAGDYCESGVNIGKLCARGKVECGRGKEEF